MTRCAQAFGAGMPATRLILQQEIKHSRGGGAV